jgi:hypothetical protein
MLYEVRRIGSVATRAKVEAIFTPALTDPLSEPATFDSPPRRRRYAPG